MFCHNWTPLKSFVQYALFSMKIQNVWCGTKHEAALRTGAVLYNAASQAAIAAKELNLLQLSRVILKL